MSACGSSGCIDICFFVFLNLMEKVASNHEVRRTVLNLLLVTCLHRKHFENVQTVVTLRLSLALN